MQQSLFTVWLETGAGSRVDKAPAGGMFTFGGLDPEHCEAVADEDWVPLMKESHGHWMFEVEKISVGRTDIFDATPPGFLSRIFGPRRPDPLQAISDTGTSFILGGRHHVDAIATAVGAYRNVRSQRGEWMTATWLINCDAAYSPVVMRINGREYSLTSKVLTMRAEHGNTCLFAIQPVDYSDGGDDGEWVLGAPFIRQYCNVYDIGGKRIGLAAARV